MQKHSPRRLSYLLIAIFAAAIGIASSAVTGNLFVLGLQRLESDAGARQALAAVGLLMIAAEIAAFGIAAYLPRHTLKGLRLQLVICGCLLLAFETVTIYMTQAALLQASESAAKATRSQAFDLRTSIDSQRAAAQALRDSGMRQAFSKNDWTRHLGGIDLRKAVEIEHGLLPMVEELAGLDLAANPSASDLFGRDEMLIYTFWRSLLISMVGIAMLSAAGSLMRAAREIDGNEPENEPAHVAATVAHLAPMDKGISPMKMPRSFSENEPSFSENETIQVPENDADEARYQRVLKAVRTGGIRPAVLAVRAIVSVGAAGATSILHRLEREGVTRRNGRTWCLGATHAHS